MRRPVHLPALDGLRGMAILLVIAHNAQMIDAEALSRSAKVWAYLANLGWTGVLLFFVLSGFLITGILLDAIGQPHALRNFIIRRTLRIFPLYYGALFVIFVMLPWLGLQPELYRRTAPEQIWLWTYLSNWADQHMHANGLPHFWSLAVEEQFYLFWPLLILRLKDTRHVAWMCLALCVLGPVSRALTWQAGLTEETYHWTTGRLDALAWGGFMACCIRIPAWREWLHRHAWLAHGAVLLVLLMGFMLTHGYPRTGFLPMVVGYAVLAITFAYLIYRVSDRDLRTPSASASGWLRSGGLRTIGKYSYGMYVMHKPLHDLFSTPVLTWLGIQPASSMLWSTLHLLGLTFVTLLAAWLSYNLYEVHFLKLKDRFA